MGRLLLVIADTDSEYTERLAAYIMAYHSNRFSINTFSCTEKLQDYLKQQKSVDILLTSREIELESDYGYLLSCRIVLTEGSFDVHRTHTGQVSKYQHAEQLISCILSIYLKVTNNSQTECTHKKNARIIAFYSPSGTTPKTACAVSMAIAAARKGFKVFYLCLEKLQNTESYLDTVCENTLSEVIFNIKENSNNLSAKLESLRAIDGRYGVSFFRPPESSLELDEMTEYELGVLIAALKNELGYDVIVINMDNGLDKKTFKVIWDSDAVLLLSSGIDEDEQKANLAVKEIISVSESRSFILNKKFIFSGVKEDQFPDDIKIDGFDWFRLTDSCEEAGVKRTLQPDSDIYRSMYRLADVLLAGEANG